MSQQKPAAASERAVGLPGREGLVWQWPPAAGTTSCPPLTAPGAQAPTTAVKLLAVSTERFELAAVQCFEVGTDLALQLLIAGHPDGAIHLIRVVDVQPLPGGAWLVGVSPLVPSSAKEVDRIQEWDRVTATASTGTGLGPGKRSEPGPRLPDIPVPAAQIIPRVRWRNVATGDSRVANRLMFRGSWPLRPNVRLKVRINSGTPSAEPAEIVVHSCSRQDDEWLVDFSFAQQSSPALIEWLEEG